MCGIACLPSYAIAVSSFFFFVGGGGRGGEKMAHSLNLLFIKNIGSRIISCFTKRARIVI